MFRHCAAVIALALFAGNALSADHSAPPKKLPTEVEIVSVPPQQATDVNIVSMPAVPPPQVNVVVPPDESTHQLVRVTWWLVGVTVLLTVATFFVGLWASRDIKRRDRAAMLREVSRASHQVMVTAARVGQMAELVPKEADRVHKLAGKEGMPPELREKVIGELESRRETLKKMVDYANFAVPIQPNAASPLLALSDRKLTQRLWNLDTQQVRLDAIRDSIADDLKSCETKGAALRREQQEAQEALDSFRRSR